MPTWDIVVDGLGRPEAPVVDAGGDLWFSDIAGDGAILRLDRQGSVETIVVRAHVGGLVPHRAGGVVASGHEVAHVGLDGSVRMLLDADGGFGFNDITTDLSGAVFAGKHAERPTIDPPAVSASLWRITADGRATFCYDGLTMANGVRFAPDASRLYHADTLRKLIWVSDIDESGLPVNRRAHFELRDGMPDGVTIDELGCLWIAAIGAGQIVRVTPDGREDMVLDIPRAFVSAVCFGGADGRTLFATAFGGEPYDRDHPGCVLSTSVQVAGPPVTPAHV